MELVTITSENKNRFLPYPDSDAAENIGRDGFQALALQTADNVLGAVLIWRLEASSDDTGASKKAVLTYFYAKNSDLGLMLLHACRQSCKSEGVSAIEFEFEEEGRESELAALELLGCTLNQTKSSTLSLTVADFMELPLSANASLPDQITSIGALTLNQMRKGIANCQYRNRLGILPDLASLPLSRFEPQLSSCVVIDGCVCGFLLVHKTPSGILEAELITVSEPAGKQDMICMIRYTIRQLVTNYPADTGVLIHRCNDVSRALAGRIFPDQTGIPVISGQITI
ncbi:MAG: hypothetical protein PUD20_00705 [bacterium]|nr:hypothetical protein [bacterium]